MNGLSINSEYPVDSLWNIFYQHIGGMMNSHFYDILTYFGALVACIIMFFVKKHIKNKWVNILLASLLSFGFYAVCSIYSYRLRMSSNWTLVAFVAPMAYLTVIGLLRGDWINRVIVYSMALLIAAYNYIYCIINEDHHKMCYTLKWFVLVFGITGYIRNIINTINKIKKAKEGKSPSETIETVESSNIQNLNNTTETENSRDPE